MKLLPPYFIDPPCDMLAPCCHCRQSTQCAMISGRVVEPNIYDGYRIVDVFMCKPCIEEILPTMPEGWLDRTPTLPANGTHVRP